VQSIFQFGISDFVPAAGACINIFLLLSEASYAAMRETFSFETVNQVVDCFITSVHTLWNPKYGVYLQLFSRQDMTYGAYILLCM
jgi:hypothetical protein